MERKVKQVIVIRKDLNMRKGKIVSSGYHEQLLKISEDYRRVFGRHLDLPPIEGQELGEIAGGSK